MAAFDSADLATDDVAGPDSATAGLGFVARFVDGLSGRFASSVVDPSSVASAGSDDLTFVLSPPEAATRPRFGFWCRSVGVGAAVSLAPAAFASAVTVAGFAVAGFVDDAFVADDEDSAVFPADASDSGAAEATP